MSDVKYEYDVFDRRIATVSTVATLNDSGGYTNVVTSEYYAFDGDNPVLTYRSSGSGTPVLADRRFYSGLD